MALFPKLGPSSTVNLAVSASNAQFAGNLVRGQRYVFWCSVDCNVAQGNAGAAVATATTFPVKAGEKLYVTGSGGAKLGVIAAGAGSAYLVPLDEI